MAKHSVRILFLVIASYIFLVSCSSPLPYLHLLAGNFYYYRGDYERATADYMKEINSGEKKGWILYNLGNVYFSLGELQAAIDKYKKVSPLESTELFFKAQYNLGVIYYQLADYERSYHYFIKALELKASDIDSKLNLEYSLQKLRSSVSGEKNKKGEKKVTGLKDSALRLLDYIHSREEYIWESKKVQPSHGSIQDW
ncbi:MAG: tetratricopeptide repeat protein [Spirochaetales bacterium]|nr:tetratricopeptide repeat protein [Spirochaetales bacterium]